MKVQPVDTTIQQKRSNSLKIHFQCRTRRIDIEEDCVEDDSETLWTQSLHLNKKPTNWFPESIWELMHSLPVLDFNTAKYNINFIEGYL